MARFIIAFAIAIFACPFIYMPTAIAQSGDGEANIALVKRCFEDARESGWRAVLEEVLADDVVVHSLTTEIGKEEKTITGKEAVLDAVDELEKSLADLPEPEYKREFYADGDTVIVFEEQTGTDVMTGKPYLIHNVIFITLQEGRITLLRGF